jgi:pimeloyl-ACP methyl ester carboxylesterase/DNA-binding CsgD family transcriptional regulator
MTAASRDGDGSTVPFSLESARTGRDECPAGDPMPSILRQRIRYATAPDGIRLAWAEAGTGPPVVKAANWLTHLEYEWESPVWRHWIRFFSEHSRFVRYDERGCGMSDWSPASNLSIDEWATDLETVVDASGATEPLTLLGISQGAATCIAFAVRHPDRVARMILYGAYARGSRRRGVQRTEREYNAMIETTRLGWGKDNPTFRQIFTSRFIPGGTPEQLQWFNELCAKTTTGEIAATLFEARGAIDVTSLLSQVRAPTLVLHARDDEITPIAEGRLLAAGIAGAEFVELDSRNHILLEHEPAWARFQDAVLGFMKLPPARATHAAFDSLSARERDILALIVEGLSNAQIAERLAISEKTVRNHTSNVFDKLGVWSRAQAMAFAHERGFTR